MLSVEMYGWSGIESDEMWHGSKILAESMFLKWVSISRSFIMPSSAAK